MVGGFITFKDNLLEYVVSRNLKGKDLEKQGDIQGAISLYEENVATLYPALHAYTRLMVLYHKTKDFKNEKRIIKIAIEVFTTYNINEANRKIDANPQMKDSILECLKNCSTLRDADGWVIYNPIDIHKWENRLRKLQIKQKG